jgi:hypothetical protein
MLLGAQKRNSFKTMSCEDDQFYYDDDIDDVVQRLSFDDEVSECGKLQMATDTLVAATENHKILRSLTACRLARDLRKKAKALGNNGVVNFSQTYSLADVESNIGLTKEDLQNRAMAKQGRKKRKADHPSNIDGENNNERRTIRTRTSQTDEITEINQEKEQAGEEQQTWNKEDDNFEFDGNVHQEDEDDIEQEEEFEIYGVQAPADATGSPILVPTKKNYPHDLLVPTKDYETLPTQISDLSSCSKEELLLKVHQLSEEKKEKDDIIRQKDEEIAALESGKKTRKSWKKALPKADNKLESRLLKEMRVLLREDYIHWVKGAQERWEEYSDLDGTMSQMMINDIKSWPAECGDKYKETLWRTLLGPRLTKEFTLVRNDVLQKMRVLYLGKLLVSWVVLS